MVLFPGELKVSKSMRQFMRRTKLQITCNKGFERVIEECRVTPRPGQQGTWITEDMKAAYLRLHKMGIAKSIEVWNGENLVGGLYGIDLGRIFCGESMFSKESNASKLAFIHLATKLEDGDYDLIDCQVYNEHLASLGAREIPRKDYMRILKSSLA